MARLVNNRINVNPGDPALLLGSNLCDYFELGQQEQNYWLEAKTIVASREFVFNGRIYLPGGGKSGTIIDNFPKGPAPSGWTKILKGDGSGYDLVDGSGIVLFGYEVLPGQICHVTVNIYAEDGSIVAESLPDQFILHRGLAKIGTGGIFMGGA